MNKNRELEFLYDAIDYLNDRIKTNEFSHFDEESTKEDALHTIQDILEIIRAGDDVIEILSILYLGDEE